MANKSPLLQHVKGILQSFINKIDNDECDEKSVAYILERTNAEHNGYYNDNSLVNYDEAMKILNIGNRGDLRKTMLKHHVQPVIINNKKCGFLRSEVEAVASIEQRKPPKRKPRYV